MIQENYDISNLSNFHTKAQSKLFYEFNWNVEELRNILINYPNEKKLFVSWWTNLLFAFDKFNWLVISFKKYNLEKENFIDNFINFKWEKTKISFFFDENNQILEVEWFKRISDIAEILYKNNLSQTLKRFIWLPWTIAGAVVGNAWCFWLEIENIFIEAEVLDLKDLKIKTLDKKSAKFSYRNSIFKNWEYIVLKAKFDLSWKNEKYSFDWNLDDILNFRLNKQPSWFTCWSFFKNPSKEHPAWKLIEQVWLKWKKINWAFFSPKHANFLMSDWTANWQDLIYLKELAQKKVKEKFNIDLVPEVNIIK